MELFVKEGVKIFVKKSENVSGAYLKNFGAEAINQKRGPTWCLISIDILKYINANKGFKTNF